MKRRRPRGTQKKVAKTGNNSLDHDRDHAHDATGTNGSPICLSLAVQKESKAQVNVNKEACVNGSAQPMKKRKRRLLDVKDDVMKPGGKRFFN